MKKVKKRQKSPLPKTKSNAKGPSQPLGRPSPQLSPEEALQFLENIRRLGSEIDEPTVAISLRIPGNILKSIKLKAKTDGKKYQSLIVEYLRQSLRTNEYR